LVAQTRVGQHRLIGERDRHAESFGRGSERLALVAPVLAIAREHIARGADAHA
jgi:hypothetical protein